jgi:hypothetical protein
MSCFAMDCRRDIVETESRVMLERWKTGCREVYRARRGKRVIGSVEQKARSLSPSSTRLGCLTFSLYFPF